MLLQSCNLGVDGCDGRARVGLQADLASVALQSAVDQSCSHASDVVCSFGVGKGLVGGGLLDAFGIGDFSSACCCRL